MIVELLYNFILCLDDFSWGGRVFYIFIPRIIVTGTMLNFSKHFKSSFGTCIDISQYNYLANNPNKETLVEIYLGPTSNS